MTTTKDATQEVAHTENRSVSFDLTKASALPDLSQTEPLPFDLMADYWTPEQEGESKRMFFDRIGMRTVKDIQSDSEFELECAFFLEQKDGQLKPVSNGSKRLVGALQANVIKQGTPLLVTFMGKTKNKTNSFKSDSWSIKPLVPKK